MSSLIQPNSHRHSRSATGPSHMAAMSQNPQNPQYHNVQSYTTNGTQSTLEYRGQQPSTPPRTPRKTNFSQTNVSGAVSDSAAKPKSKGKNRLKHVTASPSAGLWAERGTPPLTGVQSAGFPLSARPVSTPTTTAYAGPTFHASPAPSALPIPSFFSKSVPESPRMAAFNTLKDDTTSNSSDSPTPPTAQVSGAHLIRDESPLDFFFKADRAEKARVHSSQSGSVSESGPFQPPSASSQGQFTTPTSASQNRNRTTHFTGGSASGMFAMELDGSSSPGKPYGPAFSTPYSERINAARASTFPISPATTANTGPQQAQAQDRSEALKAYLFSGQKRSPLKETSSESQSGDHKTLTPTPGNAFRNASSPTYGVNGGSFSSRPHHNNFPYIQDSSASLNSPRTGSRSSGLRQEVTPTKTPVSTPNRLEDPYRSANSPTPITDNSSSVSGNNFTNHITSNALSTQSGVSSEVRNNDLRGMEDSLRRLLKLEPSSGLQGHA